MLIGKEFGDIRFIQYSVPHSSNLGAANIGKIPLKITTIPRI